MDIIYRIHWEIWIFRMHFHMQYDSLIRLGWFITHNHSQSIISCSILITIMMACCNYIIIIGLKPNTIRLFFRCRDMITTNKRWMSIIKDISNGISCATIFIPRMFPPNNYFSVRCIVSFSC